MAEHIEIVSKRIRVGFNWNVYNNDRTISSNCNLISFRNQGTTTVTINAVLILLAGQSWSFTLQPGEYMEYEFNFVFSGAGVNNLLVALKTP